MRFKWLYFLISALVLIPGIWSLLNFGVKPSVDFTGGTVLELAFPKEINSDQFPKIKQLIEEKNYSVSSIQPSGEKQLTIKMKPVDKEELTAIKTILADFLKETPQEIRFETVGPILGQELIVKTITAIVLAVGFTLLYVAFQFKDLMFGTCAILAMLHDSLVLLGVFSLLGHFRGVEIDTLFVTATLTILSFSVHDTVVVYDRIRESQKRFPKTKFEDLVNKAVTETLSRSVNNSMTIIFMLVALWLLGGATIKWFALALLVGTISGTYSSTFTAAPLLVVWNNLKTKRK